MQASEVVAVEDHFGDRLAYFNRRRNHSERRREQRYNDSEF